MVSQVIAERNALALTRLPTIFTKIHIAYFACLVLYWLYNTMRGSLRFRILNCDLRYLVADMSNSNETAIAIAIFGTIAIAKAIFQLLLLLLILLREFSNYCYWYC